MWNNATRHQDWKRNPINHYINTFIRDKTAVRYLASAPFIIPSQLAISSATSHIPNHVSTPERLHFYKIPLVYPPILAIESAAHARAFAWQRSKGTSSPLAAITGDVFPLRCACTGLTSTSVLYMTIYVQCWKLAQPVGGQNTSRRVNSRWAYVCVRSLSSEAAWQFYICLGVI